MNKLRALGLTISVLSLLSGNIPVALVLAFICLPPADTDSSYTGSHSSDEYLEPSNNRHGIFPHMTQQEETEYWHVFKERRDAENASRR